MYLSLEDYAASMEFEDDPTRNCAANILDVLLRHTSHGLCCHSSFKCWHIRRLEGSEVRIMEGTAKRDCWAPTATRSSTAPKVRVRTLLRVVR